MGSSSSSAHIVIIGSGIGSMAAAYQLAQKGAKVTVLEANDYIGGRLKSKNIPLSNNTHFVFDYGASWIHGSCSENPITQLSKKISGVKMIQTEDDSIVNYDMQGNEVGEQVQKQFEDYQKMLDKIGDYQNMNIYEALSKMNPDKLKNKFFMYNASNDVQFQTSGPLHDLSAIHGQDDDQYEGTQMLICSGYQQFAEHLSHHQNIKVLLNHTVKQVIYTEQKSIVKCANGQSFEGEHVVVGVPLGVLKNKNIKFIPELPSWKQQAIQKIHFGNVCKILIVLKDKQIQNKQHYIGVIQDNVEKRGSATYFLNISGIASLPALMTFGLGGNADELQMMPQHTLKQLISSRLSVFSEQQFTPNDFQIVRTSWRKDPNFRGTYSYSGVDTKPKHWKNIAKPVFSNNLHFCGEHTHSKYRGTVHGAYLSGKYVAEEILGQVTEKDWKFKGASDQDQNQSQGEQSNEQRKDQRKPQRQESQQSNQQKKKKKQESQSQQQR